jgi:hypothetical protein
MSSSYLRNERSDSDQTFDSPSFVTDCFINYLRAFQPQSCINSNRAMISANDELEATGSGRDLP